MMQYPTPTTPEIDYDSSLLPFFFQAMALPNTFFYFCHFHDRLLQEANQQCKQCIAFFSKAFYSHTD